MKRLWLLAALALAGCPSGGAGGNPSELWITDNGDELHIKLVPFAPPMY